MAYFTYILHCADGSLYTGWTTDIERRLQKHTSGQGAKYTRSRMPVKLLTCWEFASRQEAMSFEHKVKRLSRQDKLDLIAGQASAICPGSTQQN